MSQITPQAAQEAQVAGPQAPVTPATARRPGRRWQPLLSLGSIAALVLAWYVLTDLTQVVQPLYFPSIHATWSAVVTLGSSLPADAGATAWRVVLSWAVGCAAGTLVGLLMARSRSFFYIANPVIEALRPIPPIALIPFTLIWFGLTDTGRVVLGALSCFMILVVSTTVAARNVSPVYIRAAQSLGASPNQVYFSVVLRAIFPTLVSALRVAAALCWAVVVAAEYLGAQNGIGYLILQASHTVDTPVVLVGTIVVGIEAFAFEQILKIATAYLTRWVERAHD